MGVFVGVGADRSRAGNEADIGLHRISPISWTILNSLFTISNNEDFDLRDLDAFVAVARTRNFRRAALEQRVSVSSLSQRLRDMEERLGVRLMNRTTRSVALTEAGELLLARVGPAMSDVGDALDQVRGLRGVPSGRLRINAPPPAIDLVLAPMVAPFLKAYPKVDLEIVGEKVSFVDIVGRRF